MLVLEVSTIYFSFLSFIFIASYFVLTSIHQFYFQHKQSHPPPKHLLGKIPPMPINTNTIMGHRWRGEVSLMLMPTPICSDPRPRMSTTIFLPEHQEDTAISFPMVVIIMVMVSLARLVHIHMLGPPSLMIPTEGSSSSK